MMIWWYPRHPSTTENVFSLQSEKGRAYTLPTVFEFNPYLPSMSIKCPKFGPLNFPNFVRKCHFRHNGQQHKRRNFSCLLYLSVLVKDRHLCLLKEAKVSYYNIFLLTEFQVYTMHVLHTEFTEFHETFVFISKSEQRTKLNETAA